MLGERGENVVVLDDLSKGNREAVLYGEFVEGNTGDEKLVASVLEKHSITTVMHFAAHTIVPESVENPLKYYRNNTAATRTLLECCQNAGVDHFIFSSTAATYGIPEDASKPCHEELPTAPINPYGMSKLMSEHMLKDLSAACDLRHVILRYFNVAGCDPDGVIGQSTKNATLLIKVASEVAVGKREKLTVFGTDYPTDDGTGVRDYIHVSDLAAAHLSALGQVIDAVNRHNGNDINVEEQPRRAGDPPSLTAAVDKIHQRLDWTPKFDDLDTIVKTSLAWEKTLIQRESDARDAA